MNWLPRETWEQPELWDCDINGHEWDLVEYVVGYTGTNKWTCIRCEEIQADD